MLKHDSIEDNENYKDIFKNVDLETERALEAKGIKKELGYLHIFDEYKKKLLKEKYGIEWKTTQEMNEDVRID